jgi:hypothetical protein
MDVFVAAGFSLRRTGETPVPLRKVGRKIFDPEEESTMKIVRWTMFFTLVWLSGCCTHPGVFDKVHRSLVTVQTFYGPMLEGEWQLNDQVRQAVVAADTALLLAGELQQQWCPDPNQTQQLELQAQEAKSLAQEAGVAAASDSPQTTPQPAGN